MPAPGTTSARRNGLLSWVDGFSVYKDQTVKIYFGGDEDSQLQTSFVIADVSLHAK
jgi:hypothetical protein